MLCTFLPFLLPALLLSRSVQVHEQVSGALEAHGSTAQVERFESQSSLAFGDGAPLDAPTAAASTSEPAAPAGSPKAQLEPAMAADDAPDLIDFGDDSQPAGAAASSLNASQGTSVDAPAKLPDSEPESPVAVGPVTSNGVDSAPADGDEAVNGLTQDMQDYLKVGAKNADNPFA